MYSSCAGICVFHSHYPFSRAYSIAEQACDCAKENVHGRKSDLVEEGWQISIIYTTGSEEKLSSVRERQGTAACMARPWRITGGDAEDGYSYRELAALYQLLDQYHVSRSDVKTIGNELATSILNGRQELIRVYGHHKGLQEEAKRQYPDEKHLLKMLYDLSEVYDLWFKEGR